MLLNHTIFPNSSSLEWVTFVHGAGGSSSIWFKQVREFQKHFNVLLIDLRGHGNSKFKIRQSLNSNYTFKAVAKDIAEVLDYLKIEQSHFIGISLGTILIRHLAESYPSRVKSMIMGGAIIKMNFRSKFLMWLGNISKYFLPYLILYKLFAFIIMPSRNHRRSRDLFINEAKKLGQKEFLRWFKLTAEINPLLKWFRQVELNIPTLYIMGSEDYMFLPTVRAVTKKHSKSAKLLVINNCGHVVNVDQPLVFNLNAISFIKDLQLGAPKNHVPPNFNL
jgi:pimeloyl-ACP methyl ester carboxylesterase